MSAPPPEHKTRSAIRHWLLERSRNHRNNLEFLLAGAGVFFVGAGIIVWTERSLPSSIEQELIALAGLLCMAGGGASQALVQQYLR